MRARSPGGLFAVHAASLQRSEGRCRNVRGQPARPYLKQHSSFQIATACSVHTFTSTNARSIHVSATLAAIEVTTRQPVTVTPGGWWLGRAAARSRTRAAVGWILSPCEHQARAGHGGIRPSLVQPSGPNVSPFCVLALHGHVPTAWEDHMEGPTATLLPPYTCLTASHVSSGFRTTAPFVRWQP